MISTEETPMQWSDVVDNAMFVDLPFKIELTKFGKLLMTPASNEHGRIQSHCLALCGFRSAPRLCHALPESARDLY
jgi:hypothetical protein